MNNPLRELRERMGLSRRAFCALYNVPYTYLAGIETGYITGISRNIIRVFERAGIPEKELEGINDRYKKWVKNEALKELNLKSKIQKGDEI